MTTQQLLQKKIENPEMNEIELSLDDFNEMTKPFMEGKCPVKVFGNPDFDEDECDAIVYGIKIKIKR